jgi:hypothetical protein
MSDDINYEYNDNVGSNNDGCSDDDDDDDDDRSDEVMK